MKKRLITLLIVIFAFMMAMPASVYATTPPPADAVRGTLTVEYRYAEGQEPTIPTVIQRFGFTWYLVSQSAPVHISTLPNIRTYEYQINGAMTAAQLEDILGLGTITVNPIWSTFTKEFDQEVSIPGLLTNDVDEIPPGDFLDDDMVQYLIDHGYIKDGTEVQDIVVNAELMPTGVEFEVTLWDDGLPMEYTAHVVYRGEISFSLQVFTSITLTITSDDEDELDVYVIFAEYESNELPPPVTVIGEGETPLAPPVEGLTLEDTALIDDQTGNPIQDIADGNVPLGNTEVKGAWSFLSLLFSLVAVVIAALFGIGFLVRNRRANMLMELGDYDEEQIALLKKRGNLLSALTIVVGAITLVVWLYLDSFDTGMVWVNAFTPIIGVLCSATIILCAVTNTRNKILMSNFEEDDMESKSTVA